MDLVKKDKLEFRQISLLLGCLLAIGLISYGWVITPKVGLRSVIGAYGIVVIYGGLILWGLPKIERRYPALIPFAYLMGILAGLIFACEILLEYFIRQDNNASLGLIEYGAVFVLYLIAGLRMAYRENNFRQGMLAAIFSAVISSLIWLVVVLLVFYIFRGTPKQAEVFRAEGNYADFASSGMNDFNAFIMEDFFGAGFFHLLLMPLVAAVIGSVGAGLGKMAKRGRVKTMRIPE